MKYFAFGFFFGVLVSVVFFVSRTTTICCWVGLGAMFAAKDDSRFLVLHTTSARGVEAAYFGCPSWPGAQINMLIEVCAMCSVQDVTSLAVIM